MMSPVSTSLDEQKLRRAATYASMAVALFLIFTKLIAYLLTDSVALLSTLIDSAMDLMASGIAAYGVSRALKPADSEHRFGHGKAEALAALVQSAFITGSAILLIIEAVDRFIQPRPIQDGLFGYAVMVLAIILTFFLVSFQKYVVRRTHSLAVGADSLHYTGDVLINGSVILTIWLYKKTGYMWIDPMFAIVIVGVLLYGAHKIMRRSLSALMDAEISQGEREIIMKTALGHAAVRGVHDLRTRTDSGRVFIELHLEMDGHMSLCAAHDITEEVMLLIENRFPGADIIVHQDPEGVVEKRLDTEWGEKG